MRKHVFAFCVIGSIFLLPMIVQAQFIKIERPGDYFLNFDINTQGDAVHILADSVNFIGQNHKITTDYSGFAFVVKGNYVSIDGCVVDKTQGVLLSASHNNVITGNSINNSHGDGIRLGKCNNVNIFSNTITNSAGNGISILTSNNNMISENKITGSYYAGIYLAFSANQNKIIDNNIDSYYEGIGLNRDANQNDISGNIISADTYAIYVNNSSGNYGDANLIINGTCVRTTNYGNNIGVIQSAVENGDVGDKKPTRYILYQNYPNPFNLSTTVEFEIPEIKDVIIKVFNISGQEIATLADGRYPAGSHKVTWNAGNTAGGLYLVEMRVAGDFVNNIKVLLTK